MRKFIFILLTLLVLLNIFDSYSTFIILEKGGIELNPVMRYLMGLIGVTMTLIVVKALAFAFGFHVAFKVKPKVMPFYATLLIITNLFYISMLYMTNYQYL